MAGNEASIWPGPGEGLPGDLAGMVLDQAGDALIVIDREGVIRVWNQHCTKLFGWTAGEAVGQRVDLMIPERLRPLHDVGFNAAMASGRLRSDGRARRTKGLTADGGTVYVEMTFAVLNAPDGSALGSIAVAREAPPREQRAASN